MKKIFVMVMAAVAMSFASCGNKSTSQSDAPADQTEVSAENPDLAEATTELAAQLAAGDASKLQTAIETAKTKAAELLKENPELAKEYLGKVQNFLKENADKVREVVGDNTAVQAIVSSIVDTPAESIISSLQSQLDATGEAAQQQVEAAQQAGQQAVDQAQQAVQDAAQQQVDAAKQKANEAIDDAQQKASEKVSEAADKARKQLGL